jgi:hypothetical protein
MQEELRGPSSLIPPLDLVVIESRLGELIDNYRNALRIVSRLPRIGRLETSISRTFKGQKPISSSRLRHRWVIRPFVRLFVEVHIRAKIEGIIRVLNVEGMSLADDSDDRAKKIKLWIKRLHEFRRMLLGWGSLYGVLTKAPLISTLLPLLGAVLLQLSGVDFSGASAFGTSVTKLAQSGGWAFVLGLLKVMAVIILYLYMLFSAVVVGFGFRCKRAIFNRGETVPDLFERNPFVREIENWSEIPTTNIYQTENRLFETLQVPKPTEFPLDLVATFVPYFSFVFALVISVDLLKTWKGGSTLSIWETLAGAAFWFLVVNFFTSGLANFRERVRSKNI